MSLAAIHILRTDRSEKPRIEDMVISVRVGGTASTVTGEGGLCHKLKRIVTILNLHVIERL